MVYGDAYGGGYGADWSTDPTSSDDEEAERRRRRARQQQRQEQEAAPAADQQRKRREKEVQPRERQFADQHAKGDERSRRWDETKSPWWRLAHHADVNDEASQTGASMEAS